MEDIPMHAGGKGTTNNLKFQIRIRSFFWYRYCGERAAGKFFAAAHFDSPTLPTQKNIACFSAVFFLPRICETGRDNFDEIGGRIGESNLAN